jgi:hypothetical protein
MLEDKSNKETIQIKERLSLGERLLLAVLVLGCYTKGHNLRTTTYCHLVPIQPDIEHR